MSSSISLKTFATVILTVLSSTAKADYCEEVDNWVRRNMSSDAIRCSSSTSSNAATAANLCRYNQNADAQRLISGLVGFSSGISVAAALGARDTLVSDPYVEAARRAHTSWKEGLETDVRGVRVQIPASGANPATTIGLLDLIVEYSFFKNDRLSGQDARYGNFKRFMLS